MVISKLDAGSSYAQFVGEDSDWMDGKGESSIACAVNARLARARVLLLVLLLSVHCNPNRAAVPCLFVNNYQLIRQQYTNKAYVNSFFARLCVVLLYSTR